MLGCGCGVPVERGDIMKSKLSAALVATCITAATMLAPTQGQLFNQASMNLTPQKVL
jgi:hypothetical protein